MVDVCYLHRAQEDCSRYSSFGMEGTSLGVYCRQHAKDDMGFVQYRYCVKTNSLGRPSFGEEESQVAVYCGQHAKYGMVSIASALHAREGCRNLWLPRAEASP